MPFIKWTDAMRVKVDTIDADHEGIVEGVNALYDGLQEHRGREILGPIIDRLCMALEAHFAREEQFFERAHYPQAKQHQADHQILRQRLNTIQEQYRAMPQTSLSLSTLALFRDYLGQHIQGFDRQHAEFLHKSGAMNR